VAELEIAPQRRGIQPGRFGKPRGQGGDLRGETGEAWMESEEQRPLPGPIPDQQQPAVAGVPDGQGIGPHQPGGEALAQFQIQPWQHGHIGLVFHRAAPLGQPGAQFPMVVDFPVADHHHPRGGVDQGLASAGQAADGQPDRAEPGRSVACRPEPIRPAMGQAVQHRVHGGFGRTVHRRPRRNGHAADAAHQWASGAEAGAGNSTAR
jgi:hypothetical protein